MRRGQVLKKGGSWFPRYQEPILEDGKMAMLQVFEPLAPFDKKYKSKRGVAPLAFKLAPVNAGILTELPPTCGLLKPNHR